MGWVGEQLVEFDCLTGCRLTEIEYRQLLSRARDLLGGCANGVAT